MKKLKILIVIILFAVCFSGYTQTKIAHINTTELTSVNGVIDILVEMNWLDKGVYEANNILW